jgi:hypothetical protein
MSAGSNSEIKTKGVISLSGYEEKEMEAAIYRRIQRAHLAPDQVFCHFPNSLAHIDSSNPPTAVGPHRLCMASHMALSN